MAELKVHDVAQFGAQSYDDATDMAVRVTAAMESSGQYNPLDHCADLGGGSMAAMVLLWALLIELSEAHAIDPSDAGRRLGQEIATVRPTG